MKRRPDKDLAKSLENAEDSFDQLDRRAKDLSLRPLRKEEVASIVWSTICNGAPKAEHAKVMSDYRDAGFELEFASHERWWDIIRWAGKKGMIQFVPETNEHLENDLNKLIRTSWRMAFTVLGTAVGYTVARRGAERLFDMVKEMGTERVHIGLGGGRTMRALALEFAKMLKEQPDEDRVPITLHAMVAGGVGFTKPDFGVDPHSFMTYFDEPQKPLDINFVRLPVPGICTNSDFVAIRKMESFKAVYSEATKLQIIVTSGGCWDDDHSTLKRIMAEYPEKPSSPWPFIGDLLWQPLVESEGSPDLGGDRCSTSLMDLSEIEDFVAKENKVLLLLSACGECHKPKGKLLDAILKRPKPIVTDVIVDSLSAMQAVDLNQDAQSADSP